MLQEDNDDTTEFSTQLQPEFPQGELVLGELIAFDDSGQPLVSFTLDKAFGPLPAISTVALSPQHIGRQVGLLFAQDNRKTPVLVGLVHNAFQSILDNIEIADSQDEELFPEVTENKNTARSNDKDAKSVVVDGDRLLIEGKEEVVLRCGDSSITLHKNGKISIRGKYLLNRSSGVNRIMGGSVQVN